MTGPPRSGRRGKNGGRDSPDGESANNHYLTQRKTVEWVVVELMAQS